PAFLQSPPLNCRFPRVAAFCVSGDWGEAMTARLKSIAVASALLTTLVFVSVAPGRAIAGTGCPLTEAQAQKSIAAFSKLATFMTGEPRCVNCHGGVNPYIDATGLDFEDPFAPASVLVHGPTQNREQEKAPDGTILMDQGCKDCHNHMAPKRDGSPSVNWTL